MEGGSRTNVQQETAFAAAVMAVLLVPLLALPASAHGEHKVASYTFVVGFGTEPAYAGTTNSVQLVISDNGKPVTDAKGLKAAVSTGDAEPKEMALEPYFGEGWGERGNLPPSSSRPRPAPTPSRSPAPSAARRSTRATPPARTASTRSPTRPRSSTRPSSRPARSSTPGWTGRRTASTPPWPPSARRPTTRSPTPASWPPSAWSSGPSACWRPLVVVTLRRRT